MADEAAAAAKPHVYDAKIELPSAELASIVATALSVDDELRPALVDCTVVAHGAAVVIRVAATEARVLRTSALSILDFATVSLTALEAFAGVPGGPAAADAAAPAPRAGPR
jgi:tRNA threonylcarbamoyladenosine modification (KEOPS) complex  Pcc1 subunit